MAAFALVERLPATSDNSSKDIFAGIDLDGRNYAADIHWLPGQLFVHALDDGDLAGVEPMVSSGHRGHYFQNPVCLELRRHPEPSTSSFMLTKEVWPTIFAFLGLVLGELFPQARIFRF